MRRALLVAVGVTTAGLVVHQLSRAGALDGARRQWQEIVATVREGMTEREAELRQVLGMDAGLLPEGDAPTPERARGLVDDPTGARAR